MELSKEFLQEQNINQIEVFVVKTEKWILENKKIYKKLPEESKEILNNLLCTLNSMRAEAEIDMRTACCMFDKILSYIN